MPESGIINNHSVRLLALHYWRPSLDFKLTDHNYRASWSAEFRDQSTFELQYANNYIYLLNGFDPTRSENGVPLPGNRGYYFNQVTGQYESDSSNDLFFNVESTVGEFFNGNNFSVGGELNLNLQPWAVLSMGVNYDRIRLPDPHPDADLWLLTPEMDITFSKSLFWSTLVQYPAKQFWNQHPAAVALRSAVGPVPGLYRQLFLRQPLPQVPLHQLESNLLV